MMRSNVIDITVQKLHETDRAVLVTDSIPEKGVWLSKSLIEIEASATGGHSDQARLQITKHKQRHPE